ncbi:hypothetical protein [Listeria aquatica]|uniref:hypothetical protein n=1 Tax=Listeria aquatica TaxID=1494960 RepID=UPI0031F56F92
MISTNLKPTQDLNKFAARIRKDVLAMLLKEATDMLGDPYQLLNYLPSFTGNK